MPGELKPKKRLAPMERRAHIIAAARGTLIKSGLRGFGVAGVAKEAGVAIGLISHYFSGIEGLLTALLESVVSRKNTTVFAPPENLEAALVELTNIIEKNFQKNYYSRDNLLVWLPIFEICMSDKKMQTRVLQRDDVDSKELEAVLSIICKHRGKTIDHEKTSKVFFALLDGLWLRWCYSGQADYQKEKILAIEFLEAQVGPFYVLNQ